MYSKKNNFFFNKCCEFITVKDMNIVLKFLYVNTAEANILSCFKSLTLKINLHTAPYCSGVCIKA